MNCSEKSIILPYSLSSRVVNQLVYVLNKVKSDAYLCKNGRRANLKSILGILSVNCNAGDMVQIICIHNDKDTAEKDMVTVEKILSGNGDL